VLHLSHRERSNFEHEREVRVRGYALSGDLNPSPSATRRPLPMGEVK
jgi:hypothetical protein